MTAPIRLFIGAPPAGLDAESQLVAEFSIRKYSSQPVEITWLKNTDDKNSLLYGWDLSKVTTPFSPYRWATCYLAKTGRALYVDVDVVCTGDIAELWNMPLPRGTVVAARGGWRYCVSLWDCESALRVMMPLADLKKADGHQKQNTFFRDHPELTHKFGSTWNYLDDQDLGPIENAKIIHYTSLRSQPSHRHAVARLKAEGRTHWNKRPVGRHPRSAIAKLFEDMLAEARAAGYSPEQYY